jgi:hypothetical protein
MKSELADNEDEEIWAAEEHWRWAIRAKLSVVKIVERIMETEHLNSMLLGFTEIKTAEEYFGFAARDVSYVHHFQQGVGRGLFFRLYDGRVFDAGAKPQNPDRDLYDTTFH